VCPQERLVITSKQTVLSFMLKRIGPLAAIDTLAFYLLVLYSTAASKPPEYLSVSIYGESFTETACHQLSAPRWDRHSYLSKILRYTPYTCASSACFSVEVLW
jgi:hypothetical protein